MGEQTVREAAKRHIRLGYGSTAHPASDRMTSLYGKETTVFAASKLDEKGSPMKDM